VAEGGALRDTFQERLVDLLLNPQMGEEVIDEMNNALPAALRVCPKMGHALSPAQR
jgi:hypothetical protein